MVLLSNESFTFWLVAYGSFDCIVQRNGGSSPSDNGGGGGGAVFKKLFSALQASFWSNNKRGGGGRPPGPLPCIRHCREKAYACIVKWEGVCIQPECVRL